jgi:MFS family permease
LVSILSFVIGIPLGIWLIALQYQNESQRIVFWGFAFLAAIAIGYGIAWLLVKLPLKLALRERLVEPVGAGLLQEKKSDGKQGISVAISIPNKGYADKFAQLNGVPAQPALAR